MYIRTVCTVHAVQYSLRQGTHYVNWFLLSDVLIEIHLLHFHYCNQPNNVQKSVSASQTPLDTNTVLVLNTLYCMYVYVPGFHNGLWSALAFLFYVSEKCCFTLHLTCLHLTEIKRELSKDQEEVAKWCAIFICVTLSTSCACFRTYIRT